MFKSKKIEFITQNISFLKGVGLKTKQLLKRKNIEKISDLLWHYPESFTDRSSLKNLDDLEIGKITTIKVKVIKYNFPRIRNLPSKVICEDKTGKIDIVFFNSREGYIRKILPLNNLVVISGKIGFYKNKYQLTNPSYVVPINKENYVATVIPKYSLTEGLTEKIYRKLIEQVLIKLPDLEEWHSPEIIKKIGNVRWKDAITNLHDPKINQNSRSPFYKRLAYDEILANLLVFSELRKKNKRVKKESKIFENILEKKIITNFEFNLTNDQQKTICDINKDLRSPQKMSRLLQGDVGSGKTIVAFIAAANVIESNFQATLMAPTEILARQHFNLAKKVFDKTSVKISLLTGKCNPVKKKAILKELKNGKINFLIGTHALFQKDIVYKKLGLAIIDEQHKFGVRQRVNLSKKGNNNCDILLLSATPIPRTLVMTMYGDMDISILYNKPLNRKDIITLSKPEIKVKEIITFIKNQINYGNQIFWVCPLIDESNKLNYSSAKDKFNFLSKIFNGKVGLIHGELKKDEKEKVLDKFLKKRLDILVSTTVIEVGIDFPNANVIIIENSNKFGLSQLHQLRGRVGRGINQGTCILLYKENLSENAKKRIKILKSTNNGFEIAEEDMILRGYGDVLGYQQSGIKEFKIADPIKHSDLFEIADENIKNMQNANENIDKYNVLLKLFDKSSLINEINF